jgi:hypothetical protein
MYRKLIKEKERTGAGRNSLMKSGCLPDGLTIGILTSLLQRKPVKFNAEHWNWVMAQYDALPHAAAKNKPSLEIRTQTASVPAPHAA